MMKELPDMGELSDEGTGATSYGSAMVPLPADYTPGDFDVLVGRGKACRTWKGNEVFRDIINSRLDEYSEANTKLEKSAIVTSVLTLIRQKSPKGGFIKMDKESGRWHEVGDFIARERVTQCFRDALYDKYRSSNHSKKKRRKEQLQRAKESRQAGQDPGLVKPTKKRKTKRKAAAAASPEAKLEDPSSGASLLAAEIQGGTFNSESLSQNLRVDNLPLPNLQPPSSGKPPIQFPSLSFNDQASNTSSHVPDPTSSLHHLMERQSALSSTFQESLLKQLQPFEPNPQLQQHKEALQLFHQPNQDTLSLTNLHGTVNGEMRNGNNNADSSSYPTNWFTTSSTGSNSNSNLWPTTVNINASVTAPDRRFSISSNLSTSSVNESPVDGQQAMLLFGGVNNTSGVTNQQYNGSSSSAFSTNLQALLCNSQLSSTNSAQQTLMSMASIFQQSNNRPPATGANNNNNNYYSDAPSNFPFDLSLEPTPIAENISRRHLERNQNAFF